MTTRKVFGTIHDSRDLPWANQRVTFVLRVGSFTASTQYPRKRVEATTNAAGYFEVDLWANSDGLLPTTYQCKLPDADEFEFRLSNSATAVNLSELRGLGGISTQAPQTLLQQLEPYFLSQSEGDGRYRKLTDTIAFGDLSGGLTDGQIPTSIARVDDVTTRIAQHAAASDPHPQYLTPGEGALLFAPAGTPSATNLSVGARTATTLTIISDTGQDAIVPAANTTEAGLLAASDKAKIDTALQPGGAATPAQGAKADTALQPASSLDATKLTGTVPIGVIPAAVATDAEVAAAIGAITPLSIGADIAGGKSLTPIATDPGNTATNSGFLSWLISAMRSAQTTLSGLGSLATKSAISSADITDGTIVDGDISPAAAIGWAKINKSGAVAADVGAIAAAEKGAVNGVASLVGGKVPAAQSRGSSVGFNPATGTFDFTWADGSTQSVDTVIETLLQASNYNPTTKTITFTRANGTAFDVPIADLVDLPEIFIATQNPVSAPTTGQRLYLRSDSGEYWVNAGAAWAGPFLSFTGAERSKLAGIAPGAQVNLITSVAGRTGAVTLAKADVGLGSVDNTTDLAKPISTATQAAISAITPASIGADIAGTKTLTPNVTDPGTAATNTGWLNWLVGAMRSAQSTIAGLGSLASKSTITSADITDGTIVNADISGTAAIAISKVAGLQTTIDGLQPLDAKLTSIAAQPSIGVIKSTGETTATILPTGAMGEQLLATVDDAAARAAMRCRKTASANVVFTISPTGNDATGDGLGAGTEYATLQRAINEIAAIDGNGFTATIVPQPGTYAGATLSPSLVGWARVSVIGAAANTITINTPLVIGGKTPIALRYLTFAPTAPATNLTSINATGVDLTIRQCVFTGGDAAYNHVTSSDSVIRHIALITTNGSFGSYLKGTNTTVYHSGTINAATAATFTSFFDITDGAIVQGASAPTAPIGTFTGAKYNAAYVGFADTLIPGNIAGVRSTQAFDPTLQSIADTTATGLIQRNANESVTLLPTGAMAGPLLAAGDAAAVRGVAGLGALATQGVIPSQLIGITDASVPATASADVIDDAFFAASPITVSTAGTVTLFPVEGLFFNENSYTEFSTDTVITVPVSVVFDYGFFLIHGHESFANFMRPSSVKIELYSTALSAWILSVPETPWTADGSNLFIAPSNTGVGYIYDKARITLKGTNYRLTKIRWVLTKSNVNPVLYKKDTRLQSVAGGFGAKSLTINGGSTQTASLRGAKTINTPSLTDTITVTGAAVGDIVRASRGRDAFVSAPNTVQFDSTGLASIVVSAIVERFT